MDLGGIGIALLKLAKVVDGFLCLMNPNLMQMTWQVFYVFMLDES